MNLSSDLYWLAATARAAYANFDNMSDPSYKDRLAEGVDGKVLFSPEQAEGFAAEWKVAHHLPDAERNWFEGDPLGGGFSATLFQRKMGDNDYVLAFRGTMGHDDLFLTDVGDIVADGVASSQIIDLYNYVMELTTPKNSTFLQARREPASLVMQVAFDMLGPVGGMLAANAAGYYWDSGTAYKVVFDVPKEAELKGSG